MKKQFLKFFFNGSILGIMAYFLQLFIFNLLGTAEYIYYAAASGATYLILIVINFYIQRIWIFSQEGMFIKFLAANLLIALLTTLLSAVLFSAISNFTDIFWGEKAGFILAALITSIPSFMLNKFFVFRNKIK